MRIVSLSFIILGLLVSGCSSGDTDGGSAGNDSGQGTVFVPDDTTGGVSLTINEDLLAVGEKTGFSFAVKDSKGNPVPDIMITCDSESGIAILEPTTGREQTDAGGQISGKIGCRFSGSYQFGCRLPTGANRREFKTVRCSGEPPIGFSGFPGAAGGGLGSGGSAEDPNGGGVGGNNPDGIKIQSIRAQTIKSESALQIDTTQGTCGTGSSITAEPFGDDFFQVKVVNNTNSEIKFTEGSFSVKQGSTSGGTVSSGTLSTVCSVAANGGTATCTLPFTTAGGGKVFASTSSGVSSLTGTRTATVTIVGTWKGEEIEVEASQNFNFANYDNC